MFSTRLFTRLLLVCFCLALSLSLAAAWQSPPEVAINYQETDEQADLSVSLYFNVVDNQDQVLSQADVVSGTITLLGRNENYQTAIEQPDTPFFIILALDTSGSMREAAEDMRQAAIQAIQSAPAEAQIAVLQFNEFVQLEQTFTNDIQLVTNAISAIQVEDNGTCLYDAAHTAVRSLQQAIQSVPQARRAVILFTDGRDERTVGSGDQCSQHSYQDVIDAAQGNLPVPIHTIGLSGARSPIKVDELQKMAHETGGLSAVASQADLSQKFDQIIEALANQWLARAILYPPAGSHPATFTAYLQDGQVTVPVTLLITAQRDHQPPALPLEVTVTSVAYDENRDVYSLDLAVVSPEQATALRITVWDSDAGVQVAEHPFSAPNSQETVEITSEGMEAGVQYTILVSALNQAGAPIANSQGGIYLAAHEIRYQPVNQVTRVQIDAVTILTETVEVQLRVTNRTAVAFYKVQLENEQSTFYNEDVVLSAGDVVTIPLTVVPTSGDYLISIEPFDGNGTSLVEEAAARQWSYVAPAAPGFWTRMGNGLRAQPWIPFAIVLIILGVAGGFAYRSWAEKRRSGTPALQKYGLGDPGPPPSRPLHMTRQYQQRAGHHTMEQAQAETREPREQPAETPCLAVLHVKQAANPRREGKEVKIRRVPFFIGREGCDLNFKDDQYISRRHAQITHEQDTFFITDLGSSNGTVVNGERIEARKRFALVSAAPLKIQLGDTTTLLFETEL